MTKTMVIYHADCVDGFTAAWVARNCLPGCGEFNPAKYGDLPPDVSGRDVYVLDFSYPRDVMKKMNDDASFMVVLDHHKSAEADCKGLGFCEFDVNRSGAGMAWDFWYPHTTRPWLVNAVEDRDLWRFLNSGTREVHAYLMSIPMSWEDWGNTVDTDYSVIVRQGAAILRSIEQYCESVARSARGEVFHGYRGITATAPRRYHSELAHYLLEHNSIAQISITYFRNEHGEWEYSLRSRGDIDVVPLAERYGGGGHAAAAGFTHPKCII